MTFLNPLVLFGLAAAAIPLIIHLLNLRRLRTIEFSSLQFLRELQRSTLRRLKIRQFLLLLIRTLLIVCLVLAFSRPAIRGSAGWLGAGRATGAVVLVVDDSPSMSGRNQLGVLFEQARSSGREILRLTEPGDRAAIITASDALRRDSSALALYPSDAVASSLERLQQSHISAPLDTAIARAREILAAAPEASHELYILTDCQATQFGRFSAATKPGHVREADTRLSVFLVSIPPEAVDNVGAGPVRVATRILRANAPVALDVTVRSPAAAVHGSTPVSIYLDRIRVAEQEVHVPEGGATTFTSRVVPKRQGFIGGEIRTTDDRLEADNHWYFSVRVPESMSVLLVGPTSEHRRFARLALAASADSLGRPFFLVREESDDRLATIDMTRFSAVVLCGVRRPAPTDVQRLDAFVRNGGGAYIFPGPDIDVKSYNEVLFPVLGIPPASLSETRGPTPKGAAQAGGFVAFGAIDINHPMLSGLFDRKPGRNTGEPSVESPDVSTYLAPRSPAPGRAVITLATGQPFLSDYRVGRGRVLVSAVDAGIAWSNYAVKGIFAPLLHRAVGYLGSGEPDAVAYTTGDPLEALVRSATASANAVYAFRTPDGTEERTVPSVLPTTGALRFASSPARVPGIYTLVRTTDSEPAGHPEVLQMIPVNIAVGETDLRTASTDDIAACWRRHGIDSSQVHRIEDPGTLESAVRVSRFGVELWTFFLIAALALAILEMLVGRIPKREALDVQ